MKKIREYSIRKVLSFFVATASHVLNILNQKGMKTKKTSSGNYARER